jgi:cytochrome P450 family 4
LSSQKHIEKNDLYNVLLPWLGNGLLLSSGQKWFNKRRTITPTFHFKILEQFVEVFNRKSDILVEKLAGRADLDEEFDIYAYITLFALDVISGICYLEVERSSIESQTFVFLLETAMGTEINAQTNTESEYVRAVQE